MLATFAQDPAGSRFGIFGGTFNPIHLGHLRAAQEVLEHLRLDKIIFIPAAKPPHKESRGIVAFEHRRRMLELATSGNQDFLVSDIEAERPGKSYSVETVRQLLHRLPAGSSLFFIIGLDAFLDLHTWKDPLGLISMCHFVVVARPGYSPANLAAMLHQRLSPEFTFDGDCRAFLHPRFRAVYFQEVTLMDISSSKIRHLLASGRSVRYLVHDEVEKYIRTHRLYGYY